MNKNFNAKYGPWALVTGASSGIGKAFAHQLAALNINLMICARNKTALNTLAAELQDNHAIDVVVLAVDLSAADAMQTLLEAVADIDIGLIVSNAGFGLKGQHIDQNPETLEAMLNTNARAPMLITHGLTPKLIKRGGGGIILTGSMEGYMGFPLSAAYSATKGFVHFLGEALWQECKPHNVDVLVLAPGSTDTDAPIKQGICRENLANMMSPDRVAAEALVQLGKKRIHMPGASNRLLSGLMTHLPRRWGLALAEAGMKAALKQQ